MTTAGTVAALLAACRQAGVDAALIFKHYNAADVESYGAALDDWLDPADLHLWMASTSQTIREGRCLCRGCRGG